MDELAAALAGSFQVTHHPNNPSAPHPRFSELYKCRSKVVDQEERRKRVLERQKQKRFDFTNHLRQLTENTWDEEKDTHEEEMGEEEATMKPGKFYKNQLMLSEWMVDAPPDLATNWIMAMCPFGKRTLVVAANGSTTAYNRNGYHMLRFPSYLPGGNKHQSHRGSTLLDCVYSDVDRTFYILDVMSWGSQGHTVYDSDTEFRFYWLRTKLAESPQLAQPSTRNPYCFVSVPTFACSADSLTDAMATPPDLEVDGLLFYHKETHYTFGPTPLVLWLKPYMLPEVINIPVLDTYTQAAPASYAGYAVHVQKINSFKEQGLTYYGEEKYRRRSGPKSKPTVHRGRQNNMDTKENDSEQIECDTVGTEVCETAMEAASVGHGKRRKRKGKKTREQDMDDSCDVQGEANESVIESMGAAGSGDATQESGSGPPEDVSETDKNNRTDLSHGNRQRKTQNGKNEGHAMDIGDCANSGQIENESSGTN